MKTNGDLLEMIHEISDAVLADDMNLSKWESDFIDDMSPKLRRPGFVPSEKQEAVIVRLWNKSKGRV